MRISLIQTDIVWADKSANFKKTETLLSSLRGKTDMAILPEMFSTGFCTDKPELAEDMNGQTVALLKQWTRQFDIAIVGSFIATENNNLFNRTFFVTPNEHIQTADKRHLFSMSGEDKFFTPGNSHLRVHYKGIDFLILVCYDIRFPVWSRNTAPYYDMLICCANFPHARMNVWDILLKARAIENQAYVCGVNRVGTDEVGLYYSGHSCVVDAKGDIVLAFDENESAIKTIDINKEKLHAFRQKFDVLRDADKFDIQV